MKKILLAVLPILIGAAAVINPVMSQESSKDIAYNTKRPVLLSTAIETISINSKAVKDLRKSYDVSEEVEWYKRREGFMAVFMKADIKYRVDYDSKGNWEGTLKNYNENKLAPDIRAVVKSVYFDYNIKWVWEINVPALSGNPVYIVHIEDDKSFKNLEIHNDEMKVLEQYDKSMVD